MTTKRKATGVIKHTFRSAYNKGNEKYSHDFPNGITEQYHNDSCDINQLGYSPDGYSPFPTLIIMPCYRPVEGYARPNGQWTSIDEDNYPHATRPCGMCTGCRFKKQQEWTVRNMNEA